MRRHLRQHLLDEEDYMDRVHRFVKMIKDTGVQYDAVIGVGRGGLIPASKIHNDTTSRRTSYHLEIQGKREVWKYVQLIGFEHPDKRDKASKAGEYYGYVN